MLYAVQDNVRGRLLDKRGIPGGGCRLEESRDKEVIHYYVLSLELNGESFSAEAVCVPDEKGFELRILVRSRIPKEETPLVVVEEIESWADDVKKDYHQYHLMSFP
jgi:hypothetical protein